MKNENVLLINASLIRLFLCIYPRIDNILGMQRCFRDVSIPLHIQGT